MISPKSGSLSAILRSYKSAVTQWCRKNGDDNFTWQPRFYDRIIRADGSLDKIREYIVNNPTKWKEDKNNPSSLWM
nr:transposase [Chroococcidiopsis cubana]